MFYSCLPASSHASALRARARTGRHSATVDIHCHVMTPEAAALTKDLDDPTRAAALAFASPLTREVNRKQDETVRVQLTSVEQRIKDMDRMGIDIQACSPSPTYYYWTEPALGRECARLINNRIAQVVASHPDRFVGLGTVPMPTKRSGCAATTSAMRLLMSRAHSRPSAGSVQ